MKFSKNFRIVPHSFSKIYSNIFCSKFSGNFPKNAGKMFTEVSFNLMKIN